MRVFEKNKISPRGLILSKDEFRLFADERNSTPDPEKMKKIVKVAENYLNAQITTIPLWDYRQYMEQGSVAIYSRGYMERLDKLIYLGVAEWYENKGRFLDALLDWIWAILEMSSWVLPEHTWHLPHHALTKVPPVAGDKYMHGLELGSVYLGATLALVFTLNKEAIRASSPIIEARIIHELKERIIKPYLFCVFSWEGERGNKVNNWCPWNISNILLTTALIEEKQYDRERVVEKALFHLDNFINGYKDDGGCDEGPTYWGAAAGALEDCLEILSDMSGGKIDVWGEPIIKAMGEYIVKFNITGNRFVNFADCGSVCTHDGAQIRRYGEKCGSDILAAFGDVMSTYNTPNVHFRHPYRSLRALMTPVVSAQDVKPKAATSCYFPDLKVMIERESENPDKGFFLAVKGGTNGESHNHNDVGSFVVYYDGKPVLIDVGVGAYTRQTFSPQRYELWFMQSRYHNLPMFDNVGEKEGGGYTSRDEVYDAEARSLTMDISGAYESHVGVKHLIRTCTFGDGKITIEDNVQLDGEHEIAFSFMTHKEPTVRGDGRISLPMDRTLCYDPTSLTAAVDEIDPVGLNSVSAWGSEKLWRIRLYTRSDGGNFRFDIT